MKWIILAIGICAVAFGSWWGWISWSIVELERGWSGMIASSVVASTGVLLLGIAALMGRVDALAKILRAMAPADVSSKPDVASADGNAYVPGADISRGDAYQPGQMPSGALGTREPEKPLVVEERLQPARSHPKAPAPFASDDSVDNERRPAAAPPVGQTEVGSPAAPAPARPSFDPGLAAGVAAGAAALAGGATMVAGVGRSTSDEAHAAVAAALADNTPESTPADVVSEDNAPNPEMAELGESPEVVAVSEAVKDSLAAGTLDDWGYESAPAVSPVEPAAGRPPPPRRILAKLEDWPEPPRSLSPGENDEGKSASGATSASSPVWDEPDVHWPDNGAAASAPLPTIEEEEAKAGSAAAPGVAVVAAIAAASASQAISEPENSSSEPELSSPDAVVGGSDALPDTPTDDEGSAGARRPVLDDWLDDLYPEKTLPQVSALEVSALEVSAPQVSAPEVSAAEPVASAQSEPVEELVSVSLEPSSLDEITVSAQEPDGDVSRHDEWIDEGLPVGAQATPELASEDASSVVAEAALPETELENSSGEGSMDAWEEASAHAQVEDGQSAVVSAAVAPALDDAATSVASDHGDETDAAATVAEDTPAAAVESDPPPVSAVAAETPPNVLQEEAPQEKAPLLRSYESQGITYFLYTDGSIEAQTPGGLLRFASLQELREYIEQRKA